MIVDKNLMFTLILLSLCASCKPDSVPEISRLASALESLRTQVVAEEQREQSGEKAGADKGATEKQKTLVPKRPVSKVTSEEGNLSAELKEQEGVSSRQTEGCADRQQEEQPAETFFFEHPDKLQKFLEEVQQKIKYMMDQAQGLVDKGQADAMISALQGRLEIFERYRTQLEEGAGSQGLIMETLQVVSSNTDILSKMSEVLANAELENKPQNLYKKESRFNTFFSGNIAAAFVQKQISQQLKNSKLRDSKEFNVDPDPVSQELMD